MLPMLPGRTHAPASFIPGAQLMMREEEDEAEQLFHIMFLHVTFIKINKNQLLSPAVVDGDSSILPENV